MSKTKLVYSGFNNFSSLRDGPYTHVENLGASYDQLDTERRRIDSNLFRFTTFSSDFTLIPDIDDAIENLFRLKNVECQNRTVLSIYKMNKETWEPAKGVYASSLTFDIMSQKEFADNNIEVSGSSFYAALYSLFNSSPVRAKVSGFTTTRFVDESWKRPFIYIPRYTEIEDLVTTCSYGDKIQFEFNIEGHDPTVVEELMEDIDNSYSYALLNVNNRIFSGMNWLSNSIEEVAIELWLGRVNYEAILERI